MSWETKSIPLADEQKAQICGILAIGCDRQTAVNCVGCSLVDLRRAMRDDAAFAAHVLRAEAGVEMSHMRNLQQAAQSEKNWRVSCWWLERRSPERFGPRSAGVVTARQLKEFITILVDMLSEEVHDVADRQRIVSRFSRVIDELDEMLRASQTDRAESPAVEPTPSLSLDPSLSDERDTETS